MICICSSRLPSEYLLWLLFLAHFTKVLIYPDNVSWPQDILRFFQGISILDIVMVVGPNGRYVWLDKYLVSICRVALCV